MKLVLCATLFSATSCAYAQSSVTLYGSVDNLFDVSNQGEGTVTKLTSGGTYGSRWGLTGTEDLGDGYKAIFKLEDGFSSTTGVIGQGGALFGRSPGTTGDANLWPSVFARVSRRVRPGCI
jgi:predicted porin